MSVLVLAPHADDEVLGMGGTIARLVDEGVEVALAVLTGRGAEPHPFLPRDYAPNVREECREASRILGIQQLFFRELPPACLDYTPAWQVNKVVAELVAEVKPREVYVPFTHDLHRDHEAIAYALAVAARPYLPGAAGIERVLAYETLTETHLAAPYLVPAFQPQVFINITATLERKLAAMRAYQSQIQPDHMPRSLAGLRALATLRGTHIGCAAAEGFVLLGEYRR